MASVFAVGVGPGSPDYITEHAKKIIEDCDVVVGYEYTLKTIEGLTKDKEVHRVTMQNQEETYQSIAPRLGDKKLVVPFTGDVNFSESEVVDRLIELFGKVELVPGISSIQVAAARAHIPLDKSKVITMHVTSPIEDKKIELMQALTDGFSVILVPRPWPRQPDKHFMPSEIASYLKENGFDIASMKVHVYERLTCSDESVFSGTADELIGNTYSDMSVMVFDQYRSDSYMNYRWQWEES